MTALADIRADANYSIAEAAYALGKSRQTVYRWAKAGHLTIRHTKLGVPYIKGKEIKNLIN